MFNFNELTIWELEKLVEIVGGARGVREVLGGRRSIEIRGEDSRGKIVFRLETSPKEPFVVSEKVLWERILLMPDRDLEFRNEFFGMEVPASSSQRLIVTKTSGRMTVAETWERFGREECEVTFAEFFSVININRNWVLDLSFLMRGKSGKLNGVKIRNGPFHSLVIMCKPDDDFFPQQLVTKERG